MADSSIAVCVRIRPFSEREAALLAPQDNAIPFLGDGGLGGSPAKPLGPPTGSGSVRPRLIRPIVKPMDEQVLVFDPPDTNPLSRLMTQNHFSHGGKRCKDHRFAFDRVFDGTCSQNDVFEQTCKPLMDGILNGYNASVFAYGATGCGKTHTISGSPQDPGLIFLTMKELYHRIEDARWESEVHVRLSYLEIYNETIRDLLSAEPTPPGQGLQLREDSNNKISVVGITELVPESPESVLDIIQEGNLRRTMSPTEANAVSSRSHAVLQINVTQKPRTADTTEEMTSASLNIIDLAGSERASATQNNGARMKEGANINKSLLALGNCINALCQSGGLRKHVPYRNSKLTRLLKFSLGGNCKTVMVVCVSPSSAHYEETHNALKYANQAKNIRTKVSRNMINVDRHVAQYVQAIHELREENKELKAKLAEKGSYESAAERRKKAEAAQELGSTQKEVRNKTDKVRQLIQSKAGFEACIAAARAREAELNLRIQQIDAELADIRARKGPVPATEMDSEVEMLEGEKDILRSLLQREQEAISSPEVTQGADSLSRSLEMHHALLLAASQNQKFDSHAAEIAKLFGETMLSELETAKATVRYQTSISVLRESVASTARLISMAAKSTVALRDAAGQLEYVAGELNSTVDLAEMSSKFAELASQMRTLSAANNQDFLSLTGSSVLSAAHAGAAAPRPMKLGSSSVLRRSRRSLAGAAPPAVQLTTASAAMRSASAAVPLRAAGSTRPAIRRASLAIGGSRGTPSSPIKPTHPRINHAAAAHPTAGTATASSRAHFASSPRKTSRRPSLGGRRVSAIGLGSRTTQVPSLPAAEPLPQAKKAFRWADEAGEGTIDDKGGKMVPATAAAAAGSSTLPAAPAASNSNGLAAGPLPRGPVRQLASRIPGDLDTEDSSSATDWEDFGGEGSVAKISKGAQPAAAPSISRPVKKASGMFERNFLAKRAAANSSTLGALVEQDDNEGDADLDDAAAGSSSAPRYNEVRFAKRPVSSIGREPFGELANQTLSSSSTSTSLSGAKFTSERRAAPYSRQSLSEGGSVGPVRRKARVSGAKPSATGDGASVAPSPLPPMPMAAAPRVASGPPNNTAARLARRASSLTVNLAVPTPGNPLGRPSGGISASRSAVLGSVGENSFDARVGLNKRVIR